jgi:molybdenum cofactor sulfurtransferase
MAIKDALMKFSGKNMLTWEVANPNLFQTKSFVAPLISDTIYLDHAGATPYPISTVREHYLDLTTKLLSNPHSHSTTSISTEARIDEIRLRILGMFNADPKVFDVVFVANATAAIKLIAEGFAGSSNGFRYRYLRDVHTSLIGAGNLAREREYMEEHQISKWVSGGMPPKNDIKKDKSRLGLFAYPAQSNFNGKRFPLEWIRDLRQNCPGWYSLLDAASFLTTSPLDFGDPTTSPDFTVMSFYKIFGYPDLGAIVLRKDSGQLLLKRQFFGGGSRSILTVEGYNAPRSVLHEALEDGTLPFHTIMALGSALDVQKRLFGSQVNVANHARSITRLAYTLLWSLQYPNGQPLCQLYSSFNQGPIIAFNLLSPNGNHLGFSAFEETASIANFGVRTGALCNPGGAQKHLDLPTEEMMQLFQDGKECGDGIDFLDGKILGVIRVSFGACSRMEDVVLFVEFLRETYLGKKKTKSFVREAVQSPTKIELVIEPAKPFITVL